MTTTRDRLLLAAAQLLDESGVHGASTRAICRRAGVTAPTLYHHFGSKQGLVDAVLKQRFGEVGADRPAAGSVRTEPDHGFAEYVTVDPGRGDTDPIDAVRAGWDAHVRFGLAQPTFYVLLHSRIRPGVPSGITGPAITALTGSLRSAATAGRLRVPPARAAAQILAANVGATLSLIAEPPATRDLSLSEHLREAVITAVTLPAPTATGTAAKPRASGTPRIE